MGRFIGPNSDGFGRRGFFGSPPPAPPVTANFVVRTDAGAAYLNPAAGGDPANTITGDFSTLCGQAAGLYCQFLDSGADFVLIDFSGIPQFAFTNLHFIEFGQDRASAAAVFAAGCGTNQYTWLGGALGLAANTVYHINVT